MVLGHRIVKFPWNLLITHPAFIGKSLGYDDGVQDQSWIKFYVVSFSKIIRSLFILVVLLSTETFLSTPVMEFLIVFFLPLRMLQTLPIN